MAKILSIIIIIIIFAGGGWYYKNNMKAPAEGSPVGYESGRGDKKNDKEDRYDNKFDNKSFIVAFPNASTTLVLGQKVDTKWNSGFRFNLKSTYPVVLINTDDKTKKPIQLGTTKNSLFNKVFTWTVPQDITPGNYKIVFLGKQGGESQVFKIALSAETVFKFTSPTASTTMYLGKTGEVQWTGSDYGINTYGVYLERVTDVPDAVSVFLGNVDASQKYFSFKVPDTIGGSVDVKITFKANGIPDKSTDPFYLTFVDTTPKITKISSTIATIKNNNIDNAVSVDMRMNIQAVDGDIPVSGTVGTITLKDATTGVVYATSKPIQVVTESGLQYFTDGSIKPMNISTVFASSSMRIGVSTNLKASLKLFGYKYVNGEFANWAGPVFMDSDNFITFTIN